MAESSKVPRDLLAKIVWLSLRKQLADDSLLDIMREASATVVRLTGAPPEAYRRDNRDFAEVLAALSPDEKREAQQALDEWRIANTKAEMDVRGKLFAHHTLVAVGRPQHPGADFERIPADTLNYLHIDRDQPNVLRGKGKNRKVVYFSVGLIPLAVWEAATRDETQPPLIEGDFIDVTEQPGPPETPPEPSPAVVPSGRPETDKPLILADWWAEQHPEMSQRALWRSWNAVPGNPPIGERLFPARQRPGRHRR